MRLLVNNKALNKNKVAKGFFTVDRNYINKKTTFSVEEQIQLDERLHSVGVLINGSSPNNFKLDLDKLTGLLLEQDEKLVSSIVGTMGKKMTKKEAIAMGLKSNIQTTNAELVEAYSNWIDAVLAKFGWMSKKAVMKGQARIDEYTQKDLDIALGILELASINGYRDMDFAINLFEKKYAREMRNPISNTSTVSEVRTKLGEEEY